MVFGSTFNDTAIDGKNKKNLAFLRYLQVHVLVSGRFDS